MVEVFKTNVRNRGQSRKLVALLLTHFPASRINFDLQDCDKILRIEGVDFDAEKVIVLLQEAGYSCTILD
ncbi:hypothetical protein [Pontibacter sp. SGAir0037]|uniref:hypothetical protein n=1 Tax=Pontibacter sp. SGAir0037 TaxID=2571030 RepID=UPI0010CD6B83|nr:hypothetical protein [Pontibacter sp. SGAir0037]QCR22120.1 hypothetical protein C1N53_07050 [Pontibacter sp. SGAir0037]